MSEIMTIIDETETQKNNNNKDRKEQGVAGVAAYWQGVRSSLTMGCSLPIFTANETTTNLMQYELSHEVPDLLKAGLYF